ncbi:MAG: hypothetical protein RLZZ218_688 [Actinomycetota bacterium]
MAHLLVLSENPDKGLLPSLALLSHKVRHIPAEPAALINAPGADLILLDARKDLVVAKSLASVLKTTGLSCPLFLVISEGGLAAISAEWGADDFLLDSAGPAEIDARIRLALTKNNAKESEGKIQVAGVVIDDAAYSAKVNGKAMDLTFKEFELLKFLAQHPGRVFTRDQLISEDFALS